MILATQAADGTASCRLCDWRHKGLDWADTERAVGKHLRERHSRVMVNREEKGKTPSVGEETTRAVNWMGPRWVNDLEG